MKRLISFFSDIGIPFIAFLIIVELLKISSLPLPPKAAAVKVVENEEPSEVSYAQELPLVVTLVSEKIEGPGQVPVLEATVPSVDEKGPRQVSLSPEIADKPSAPLGPTMVERTTCNETLEPGVKKSPKCNCKKKHKKKQNEPEGTQKHLFLKRKT